VHSPSLPSTLRRFCAHRAGWAARCGSTAGTAECATALSGIEHGDGSLQAAALSAGTHRTCRYASVTVHTLVPLVFKQDMPGSEAKYVSVYWANASAAGTLIAGLLCPFIGAAVDQHGLRKVTLVVTSVAMVLLLSYFSTMDPSVGCECLAGYPPLCASAHDCPPAAAAARNRASQRCGRRSTGGCRWWRWRWAA
jgi:hypothetical protein